MNPIEKLGLVLIIISAQFLVVGDVAKLAFAVLVIGNLVFVMAGHIDKHRTKGE